MRTLTLSLASLAVVGGGMALAFGGASPASGAATPAVDGFQWFLALSGPHGGDAGDDLAVDDEGNLFVAGYQGGLDMDADGTVDLPGDQADPVFFKFSQRPTGKGVSLQWVQSPSSPGFNMSNSIAPDRQGGAYALGRFRETITFSPTLTLRGGGQNDAFLARYGKSGDVLWARAFGGAGQDALSRVASDAAGNAYVVGWGEGSFPLDDNGARFRAGGGMAMVVASYDPGGTIRWAHVVDAPAHAIIVEVAPDGEVLVSGETEGAIDFDGDGTVDIRAPAMRDGFVARFGPDGTFRGAWALGPGPGFIAFAADGDVFLLGIMGHQAVKRYGPADFDGDGTPDVATKGDGKGGAWIARYGRDGTLRWVRSYVLERPTDLVPYGDRLVMTGGYHGILDLDEDGVPERVDQTVDASLESEIAILVLSGEDGTPEQVFTAPGPGRDMAAAGGFLPGQPILFVTGYIQLTADFSGDGKDGEGWAKCEALGDIFVASYRLGEERRIHLAATRKEISGAGFESRLTWTGLTSAKVDVYRNGTLLTTVADTGGYVDMIPHGPQGRKAPTYRVCEAGTQRCSRNVSAEF